VQAADGYFRSLRAYRAFVRGLRLALCGAAVAVVSVLAIKLGVPKVVAIPMIILVFVCALPGLILAMTGFVRLVATESHRMSRNQTTLIRILMRDVVGGLPRMPE
jgi:hypothetical protein